VLDWIREAALRPIVGALIPVATLALVAGYWNTGGWPMLIGMGIGYVLLFALVWFAWVLRGDPDLDLSLRRKRS
jgi:hypothetical protein